MLFCTIILAAGNSILSVAGPDHAPQSNAIACLGGELKDRLDLHCNRCSTLAFATGLFLRTFAAGFAAALLEFKFSN